MKSILICAVALASFFCTPVMAEDAFEGFDHLPAQEIHRDTPLVLDHFSVSLPFGGLGVIRETDVDDGLESGMVLSAPAEWNLATFELTFNKPWERVTFTLVLPPNQEERIRTLVMLYGADPASPATNVTLFWHGPERRRVRVEMVRLSDGEPFQRVLLHLMRGAYVDNIHVEGRGSDLTMPMPTPMHVPHM